MGLDGNGKLTVANIIISLFTAAMLGWIFWLTSNTVELLKFAATGDRFTASDAQRLHREILVEVKNELPPKWLTDAVERISKEHGDFEDRIDELERNH